MRIVHMNSIKDELVSHIRAKRLLPVIGSGFTAGCSANRGIVPTGTEMLDYMENYLHSKGFSDEIKELRNKSYSKLAYYYNKLASNKDQSTYIHDNFLNVSISDRRLKFLSMEWDYVYTLNIDDGIEKNSQYKMVLAPNRPINERVIADNKCLFKIHGDAEEIYKYEDGNKYAILNFDQYVKSLTQNKFLLQKLTHDYLFSNILFLGCSLDDEVDMLVVFKAIERTSGYKTNRYIVCNREPGPLKQLDLEAYGIDTVVMIDTYDWFYEQFERIYLRAKSIPDNHMAKYCNIKSTMHDLSFGDNVSYLLKGKKIFNIKTNELMLPAFFVKRTIATNVVGEMGNNRLQFIFGGRISGKSYCLVAIAGNIKNRDVYYFDSRLSIHEDNLLRLIAKENTVLLIDTHVLSKNCIRVLIEYDLEKLRSRNTNIVLCINKSDKEILGLIGSKISNTSPIGLYEINNKFDPEELNALNYSLARLSIPIFEAGKSILDNIFEIERITFSTVYKEIDRSLVINTEFEMALCILLATFEKIDSQAIVDYHLVQESFLMYKRIPDIIEEHYALPFEIFAANSSYYKLVCNAEYWLMERLGEYAAQRSNHPLIQDAYYHLVKCLLGKYKNYKAVEDVIKFDIINAIFAKKEKGTRALIKAVYDRLNTLLADSYQYNHQKAKCYLWGIDYSSNPEVELMESLRFAQIAKRMVSEHLRGNDNEMLKISFAHINYTLSIIYLKLNKFYEYKNIECFKRHIQVLSDAINSKYNDHAFNEIMQTRDANRRDLREFLDYCLMEGLAYLGLTASEKAALEGCINRLLRR